MAAGDTNLTMIGNLVSDPELRFTPSGAAVAKFTVASTPRYLDKNTNEWKDGDSLFLQCQIWRQAAENVEVCLSSFKPVCRGESSNVCCFFSSSTCESQCSR